jgi:hypothetical protein
MIPEMNRTPQLGSLARRLWTAVFRISALVLSVSMAAIVGFTATIGYSWVYWVAAGSSLVCLVSAGVLSKIRSEESAGDAAWLLGYRERGSNQPLDVDVDD